MGWFKGDDKLHGHPKARRAGMAPMGLWVMSGSYSSDYGLDGHVPTEFVSGLPGGRKLASKLVEVNLWHQLPYDGPCRCILPTIDRQGTGWVFHDWNDCNPTVADLQKERSANAERQRKFRGKKLQDPLPEE